MLWREKGGIHRKDRASAKATSQGRSAQPPRPLLWQRCREASCSLLEPLCLLQVLVQAVAPLSISQAVSSPGRPSDLADLLRKKQAEGNTGLPSDTTEDQPEAIPAETAAVRMRELPAADMMDRALAPPVERPANLVFVALHFFRFIEDAIGSIDVALGALFRLGRSRLLGIGHGWLRAGVPDRCRRAWCTVIEAAACQCASACAHNCCKCRSHGSPPNPCDI